MIRSIRAAFIAATLMFSAGAISPAAAAGVTSHDPATVVAALQNAGYKAKLVTDKDGSQTVETASEGNDISIAFLGCKDNKACDQLEFLAFWDCSDDLKRCRKLHETWSNDELFAKSLIMDKSIVLYRHLMLDEVGVSEGLFIRNLTLFSNDAVSFMGKF